jgi:hypothetical protein
VAKYEEGNSRICVKLWDLSTSKDRTLETCWGFTVIVDSRMEMGGYFYDFVMGLPRGRKGNDAIWVVVDRLTKSVLFFPMKMTDLVDKLTKLYVNEVIKLYGVPVLIISNRDPRFTSRLWPSLQRTLGTKLNVSTTFHP